MTGYVFAVSCLTCGGPLDHQADGTVTTTELRSETQVMANCPTCRRPHRVSVQVTSVKVEARVLSQLGRI